MTCSLSFQNWTIGILKNDFMIGKLKVKQFYWLLHWKDVVKIKTLKHVDA